MVELQKQIMVENEDKIKNICERINELVGYSNVIYSAITNEGETLDTIDISNTIYLLSEQLKSIRVEALNYVEFSERSGLFGRHA
ncbi:hypothetical protein IJZ97_03580 [bacterium]|nr:hypothetical protein [bacterium]